MEFSFEVNKVSHLAMMTNIYSLSHLNIHNLYRMQLFICGAHHQKTDIIKRVYQLSVIHIKFHAQRAHGHIGAPYTFHFSFTGSKSLLEKIRSDLGIIGSDMEEEIEDFDDEVLLPMGGLSLK